MPSTTALPGDHSPATQQLLRQHQRQLEATTSLQPGYRSEHRDRVNSQKYETIDATAMYMFPTLFFLVNICYWSYYLLFFEHIQQLW